MFVTERVNFTGGPFCLITVIVSDRFTYYFWKINFKLKCVNTNMEKKTFSTWFCFKLFG